MKTSITGLNVVLVGTDGNVFALMGKCLQAMRKAKVDSKVMEEFRSEVMSSENYDEALQVMMKYFDVE